MQCSKLQKYNVQCQKEEFVFWISAMLMMDILSIQVFVSNAAIGLSSVQWHAWTSWTCDHSPHLSVKPSKERWFGNVQEITYFIITRHYSTDALLFIRLMNQKHLLCIYFLFPSSWTQTTSSQPKPASQATNTRVCIISARIIWSTYPLKHQHATKSPLKLTGSSPKKNEG